VHEHVTVAIVGSPVVVLSPNTLEHFQSTQIVKEPTLTLDFHAALSHDGAMLGVHTLGAHNEEWPQKELVHTACNTDLRDVVEALRNEILKVERSRRERGMCQALNV
jgi:hypothetical protein